MTYCHPSMPCASCEACALRNEHFPALAEHRPHIVLIDASSLGHREDCPMFAPAEELGTA